MSIRNMLKTLLPLLSATQLIQGVYAAATLQSRQTSNSLTISDLTSNVLYKSGFWFTNITIGNAIVELMVDTGSADAILFPGTYSPGSDAVDLDTPFELTYGTTTNSAGDSSDTIDGVLYNDTVIFGSLTLHNHTIGDGVNQTSDTPGINGILGFGSPLFSGTNSTTFFHHLCEDGLLPECRFGLSFSEDGTGNLTLGVVNTDIVKEQDLVTTPLYSESGTEVEWFIPGDLAINSKIVQRDIVIELDSGTSRIVGPIAAVSEIFNQTGIQAVLQTSSEGETLVGYFACDNPPTVGFSLPAQSNLSATAYVSNSSTVFNILDSAWIAVDNGNNNCTATISGFDYAALPGLWVVGQAFFQGKYVDHNLAEGVVGIATLSSSVAGNGTSNSTVTTSSPSIPTASSSAAGRVGHPVYTTFVALAVVCSFFF